MANYSMEDVEILRKKGNLSYQEAVNLMEYHNGNLGMALIELERNGKLTDDANRGSNAGTSGTIAGTTTTRDSRKNDLSSVLLKLIRYRIQISRNDRSLLNVSVLFAVAAVLGVSLLKGLSLPVLVVLILISGCRIRLQKTDDELNADSVNRLINQAADKARKVAGRVVERIGSDNDASRPQDPQSSGQHHETH